MVIILAAIILLLLAVLLMQRKKEANMRIQINRLNEQLEMLKTASSEKPKNRKTERLLFNRQTQSTYMPPFRKKKRKADF